MGAIILIGLSLTLTSQAPIRSVRTVDPLIQSVIEKGIAQSATFRSLIDTLADTDVIVYVESRIVRDGLLGLTSHHIIIRGPYRYLRVAIDPHRTIKQQTIVLAHELQHAIEIAHAFEVGRSQTADRLFARIGFRFGCERSNCYETREALATEHRVRAELNASDDVTSTSSSGGR
jgi:hypothetical protein